MVFRVRLEMYGRRTKRHRGPAQTTIPGRTPPAGRERIVERVKLALTHHQTTPDTADRRGPGVPGRVVNATKVDGDGVSVDLATSRFTATRGPSGSRESALMQAPAGLHSPRRLFAVAAAALTIHGDMHPGNMLVLRDGRIGLLDFGVLGHLDAPSRGALCDLLLAVVDRRFGDVALALFGMIDVSGVDQAALVQEVGGFLAAHLDTSLAGLDLCATITGILGIASRNGCTLRDSLVTFIKQLLYIDGVCRELDPDFDVLGDARPIIAMARDTECVSAHIGSTIAA
jgi:hypothetical protein